MDFLFMNFLLGTVTTPGIETADVVSGFSSAAGDVLAMISGLLPVALGVFAAIWGIRKAMSFFKQTAK